MSILVSHRCENVGGFFLSFSSLCFLKLTLNFSVSVFLKLETEWLR